MIIELTTEELETLAERLDIQDGIAGELRTDYSGRGMYGKECLGYVGEDPVAATLELARIMAYQEDPDIDASEVTFDDVMVMLRDALMLLGEPRQDSMGLDVIHYWPKVRVVREDAEV